MGTIALTTDFGTRDYYVGAMKGVILTINPEAGIVDVSHEVAPGDIRSGAYLLGQVCPCFPPETIHLVVIDPGVGGDRRPIAIRSSVGTFVGPDNGVFTQILARYGADSIVEIAESRYFAENVSPTFHGRDLFAPVAAHLSTGTTTVIDLGRVIDDPVRLELFEAKMVGGVVKGTVIHLDRFGNIITSVPEELLQEFLAGGDAVVEIGGKRIYGLDRTYSSVEDGRTLALIGSSGHLEISVNGGSASEVLGVDPGDDVTILKGES